MCRDSLSQSAHQGMKKVNITVVPPHFIEKGVLVGMHAVLFKACITAFGFGLQRSSWVDRGFHDC